LAPDGRRRAGGEALICQRKKGAVVVLFKQAAKSNVRILTDGTETEDRPPVGQASLPRIAKALDRRTNVCLAEPKSKIDRRLRDKSLH